MEFFIFSIWEGVNCALPEIFKLVKYYISGNYREFGRLKTFLGDIVSVVRK